MKVRYTPEAFADRERILEYVRERSPSGARNVAASIREAVAKLGDQPLSGHRTENPRVRITFVVRYPYKIFYRISETVVEILHIRHTSRRAWNGDR
jgi:plasmid stabilization system protein ParE